MNDRCVRGCLITLSCQIITCQPGPHFQDKLTISMAKRSDVKIGSNFVSVNGAKNPACTQLGCIVCVS